MIKVTKKVDEQFKQVVQIAIERNPLEPFKWLQKANSVKGEWGEGLEELDNISTEQMMLMYTMGYEVIEEVLNDTIVRFAVLDANNRFVDFEREMHHAHCTDDMTSVYLYDEYFDAKWLADFIEKEYLTISKDVLLELPLRVCEIELKYKVTDIDTSLD